MIKKLLLLLILITAARAQHQKPILGEQIDRKNLISKNIVGCWLFNEGTGTQVFDVSGNGNTGTLAGSVAYYTCKFGPGIDFPGGAGDYISTSLNYQTSGYTSGTISIWVNMDSWVNSDRLWDMRGSTVWSLITYSNKFNYYKAGAGGIDVSTAFTITAGQWYHLVCTWDMDNNTAYLYADGALVGGTTSFTTANNGGDLWFGAENDNTNPGNFKMDHVMAWNRPLSAPEISDLFRNQFQMFRREPVELYATAGAAPPGGGTSQVIFISSIPGIIILILAGSMAYSRKAA